MEAELPAAGRPSQDDTAEDCENDGEREERRVERLTFERRNDSGNGKEGACEEQPDRGELRWESHSYSS